MSTLTHLPRGVLKTELDVIAPEGGFEDHIHKLLNDPDYELVIRLDLGRSRTLAVSVMLGTQGLVSFGRGKEVFLERITITVLDEIGNSTRVQESAWISLNPEVKTQGLPAGKLIFTNVR